MSHLVRVFIVMMAILSMASFYCFGQGRFQPEYQVFGTVNTNSAQFFTMPFSNLWTGGFNSNKFTLGFWMRTVKPAAGRAFTSWGSSSQSYFIGTQGAGNSNLWSIELYASNGSTLQGSFVSSAVSPLVTDTTAPHQFVMMVDILQSNPTNRTKVYIDGRLQVSADYLTETYPTSFVFRAVNPVKICAGDFSTIAFAEFYQFFFYNGQTPSISNLYGYSTGNQGQMLDLRSTAPLGLVAWWQAGNVMGNATYTNDLINTFKWTQGGLLRVTNAPMVQ